MNTLVIVLIAAVVLFGAYMVYGRWLAKKWGIDPKAETPAVKYNDGKDFVHIYSPGYESSRSI
jgi:carbon starvation protein